MAIVVTTFNGVHTITPLAATDMLVEVVWAVVVVVVVLPGCNGLVANRARLGEKEDKAENFLCLALWVGHFEGPKNYRATRVTHF